VGDLPSLRTVTHRIDTPHRRSLALSGRALFIREHDGPRVISGRAGQPVARSGLVGPGSYAHLETGPAPGPVERDGRIPGGGQAAGQRVGWSADAAGRSGGERYAAAFPIIQVALLAESTDGGAGRAEWVLAATATYPCTSGTWRSRLVVSVRRPRHRPTGADGLSQPGNLLQALKCTYADS
jgi:hypothetical protein